MARPSLDSVPLEVLYLICEYIDQTHKSSLQSVALVNKRLHSIAITLLFRTVKISVEGREKLVQDVQLIPMNAVKHVRHLILDGWMPPLQLDTKQPPERLSDARKHSSFAYEILVDNSFRSKYQVYRSHYVELDDFPPDVKDEREKAWNPLAMLLQQFSALSTLAYNCLDQFPPCLLNTLHVYHPDCKLIINTFHLRSLTHGSLGDYECALATSPCLHYISVVAAPNPRRQPTLNTGAVLDLVSCLPNLKEVLVPSTYDWETLPGGEIKLVEGPGLKRVLVEQNQIQVPAVLRRLEWQPCVTHLVDLSKRVDTSAIEVLGLRITYKNYKGLLHHLAASCTFPSLKTLKLWFWFTSPAMWNEEDDGVRRFLGSVPPLKALKIDGYVSIATFHTIMEHHGKNLRRLHILSGRFHPSLVFKLSHVEMIKSSCPHLHELTLSIQRTVGDITEVTIYKTLGSFAKLQSLFLILDCSYRGDESEENGSNQGLDLPQDGRAVRRVARIPWGQQHEIEPPWDDVVRGILINSAVDKNLARAIFRAISAGKQAGDLPLELLQLYPIGAGKPLSGAGRIISNTRMCFSRSWQVERNPRDDRQDELVITELRQPKPEELKRLREPDRLLKIISSIWPPANSDEPYDWRASWHSYPLQDS